LWIDFFYLSKRYRRSLELNATKANIKLAEAKIIPEIVYKLNQGVFFEIEENKTNKDITVDEMAKMSFEMHKHERRELTRKGIEGYYKNRIKKQFGGRKVTSIKASEIAIWQSRLLDTLATKTVKDIRTVFNTILEDAMRDEIIDRNPFRLVKSPILTDVREKNPFSVEEIFTILENVDEKMRAFFALGFFTGMRTGELIGLKWCDIDFKEATLRVERSRREGIESLPKTKNSIREIEILDALMPYLKHHRAISRDDQIYVFETYMSKPFNTVDKISVWYWRPLLEKLNIKYRNLYQMRHTFASMMIANGEDILWVSAMLGHKDSSMTLSKYARYIKVKNKKRGVFLVAELHKGGTLCGTVGL